MRTAASQADHADESGEWLIANLTQVLSAVFYYYSQFTSQPGDRMHASQITAESSSTAAAEEEAAATAATEDEAAAAAAARAAAA